MKNTIKKVPGFRTGTVWNQFFASFFYGVILLLVVYLLLQSLIFAGVTVTLFLTSLIFLFDMDDIWMRLRLPKHDPLLRVFIVALYMLLALSLWLALAPKELANKTIANTQSIVGIPTEAPTAAPVDFRGPR
ncbi:MAG: hypothetical protein WCP97_01490 [bacterium]